MKNKLTSILLGILLTSCAGQPIIQNNAKIDRDEIAEAVSATLTAVASEVQPLASSEVWPPERITPEWLLDPERPTGKVFSPALAGLVYRINSVWLVDQVGVSHMLMGKPANGVTSPDGTGFLMSSDLTNGENILYYRILDDTVMGFTHTPDLHERNYQWWPSRSNVIVYNFIPTEELGPWSGYLAALDITSGETIIIDDEHGSGTNFALSPDGERIAYLQESQPVIYTWGGGSQPINMEIYGLTYQSYSTPAWSADGAKLAFYATGQQKDGGVEAAIVILDLQNNAAEIIHEFLSFGMRVLPELAFSPDGQWLASVNPGEITESGDPVTMWVYELAGDLKINLGFATSPFWRPEGGHLLYTAWPSVGSTALHDIVLIEIGAWEPIVLDELKGSFINDWISLPE